MLATSLTILLTVLKIAEVLLVTALVLIGIDLGIYYYKGSKEEANRQKQKEAAKAQLRREKEESAHEGFFEDRFVRGFDSTGALINRGYRVPTQHAWDYYNTMEQLAETQTFLKDS